ncbi:MAG TPA: hypothetical protein VGC89_13285 [Pyrinomonadaceae bacterium]
MRRISAYLGAVVIACGLAFALSTPVALRVVKASDLQQQCDDCTIRNARQFDQCLAVHGETYQRCYDDYNEGVVHCFAHFCEQ